MQLICKSSEQTQEVEILFDNVIARTLQMMERDENDIFDELLTIDPAITASQIKITIKEVYGGQHYGIAELVIWKMIEGTGNQESNISLVKLRISTCV